MTQKLLLSILLSLALALSAFAQTRTVTGKVTDSETSEPVPGVSVFVKGTTTGTITDINGSYTLKSVPQGAILVFQAVGMKTTEQALGSQSTVNLSMDRDVTELGEVVVTGYSEESKTRLTGSVATVSSETIEQVPIASFDQILQGQAPGLNVSTGSGQPGTTATFVRIRGIGSINAGSEPLFVIDGVPVDGDEFRNYNPNDFASVTVLKDASSASIYGSRAANGVIVITTKQGKAGKTKVGYRFQQGWTTRTQSKFTNMNSAEKLEFERLLAAEGFYTGKGGAIYEAFDDGDITAQERDEQISALAAINTDWPDEIFRTGKLQSHEVNASGGNENGNFYLSASYRKEDGILPKSDLERYTLRFNINQNATDKLRFGIRTTIGYSESNFLASEAGASVQNPVLGIYISNPYETPDSPATSDNFIFGYNPLRVIEGTDNTDEEFNFLGSAYVEYDITDFLTARVNYGIDHQFETRKRFDRAGSPQGGIYRGGQGRLTRANDRYTQIIGTHSLQFNKVFAEKHNITAIAANEIVFYNFQNYNLQGFGVNNALPGSLGGITQTPDFQPVIGGSNAGFRLISFFADGTYTYNGKYSLKAGVRRDGSSRFGEESRFGTFWSVGANWNITEEEFMSGISFLDNLRLRASYGTQGNQQGIGNFSYLALYSTNLTYNGLNAIAPGNIPNPEYKWEVSNIFNVGLDFAFLKGRITGNVDYYNNLTTDLFINTQLSRTTGFTALSRNVGEMRNSGIEIALNTVPVKIGAFEWELNANFTYNKNRIEDLFQEEEFELGTSIVREGLPLGSHYVVEWLGVDPATGDALYSDINGNVTNVYNDANRQAFGTWDPPRFGSFTNIIRYKGLEISALFIWAEGHQLFNNQRFFNNNLNFSGIFNQDKNMVNFWREEGQITDVPRIGVQRQFSSQDLEDGSYLRLRNVTVSYNFPTKWLEKTKVFRSARVYLMGQNLFTVTEFTGFDPENNDNLVLSNYPVPRTYLLGVDIGF